MKFTPTTLAGLYVVDLVPSHDERGFFARSYDATQFSAQGLVPVERQCSVSFNARRGTLRGLHYQAAPCEEHKLVRVTAGSIFDVAVDLRAGSSTYLGWYGAELSAANRRALYIPKGFAHGFLSLEDSSEVLYMISTDFSVEHARGVRWDDPAIGIEWPLRPTVVSARDALYALLEPASR